MRPLLRLVGTVFMLTSALGLALLGAAVLYPQNSQPIPAVTQSHVREARTATPAAQPIVATVQPVRAEAPPETTQPQNVTQQSPSRLPPAPQPITRVEIPAIGLSADVVPAQLIPRDGGMTWDVPPFKIGHAETTADAGQVGNAVLFGHVSSLRSGNVFAHLDQVDIGQSVRIFADTQEFDYVVVSSTHVPRTDVSAMGQDGTTAVSLITCTGVWLPTIWDYTERLVVRAELDPVHAAGPRGR